MSNKINELNGGGPGASPLGASQTAAPVTPSGAAPAQTAGAGGDVHITDTATWLATLEPALREAPAVDVARVAGVRAAIETGRYTVQPEHVAEPPLYWAMVTTEESPASAKACKMPLALVATAGSLVM